MCLRWYTTLCHVKRTQYKLGWRKGDDGKESGYIIHWINEDDLIMSKAGSSLNGVGWGGVDGLVAEHLHSAGGACGVRDVLLES